MYGLMLAAAGPPVPFRKANHTSFSSTQTLLDSVQCLPAVDDLVQCLVHQPAHLLRGYTLAGLLRAQ
jgi:hypothetical protein